VTHEELLNKRDELCFRLVEADSSELEQLEQELMWIEELLNERLEQSNEEV
jgi:hypothetical protein